MKIIRKLPNANGAYPPIQEGAGAVYEGYALWPDTLSTDTFYAYNGFVLLTVESIGEEGMETDVVNSYTPNTEVWEEWKKNQPDPVEPEEPTEDTSVWDELDKAYTEGVNGAYDE